VAAFLRSRAGCASAGSLREWSASFVAGRRAAPLQPDESIRADLVAFDPATVGTTAVERVHDQPGGADRLIVRPTGVEHTWVNGTATRLAGENVPGAAPGRLLRGGAK
jgi:hypothetical protein